MQALSLYRSKRVLKMAPVLTYSVAFPYFGGVSAPVLTNKPNFLRANEKNQAGT